MDETGNPAAPSPAQFDGDKGAKVRTPYEIKSAVEAVLFAAGYPVKYEKLASVLDMTVGQIKKTVSEYAKEYNSQENSLARGILLLTYDDACQLCTKEEYGKEIRDALGIKRGGNLSQSSIEVLAIVAYNEPVTRAFIDTVRGVDSSYAVSTLADKHLIEVCGRLDVPGRPLLYRTTDDFLRVFGISSLSELPDIHLGSDGEQLNVLPLEDVGNEGEDEDKENAENITDKQINLIPEDSEKSEDFLGNESEKR